MRLYQITEADVDTSTGEVHRWHDRRKLLKKYAGDPSVFVHFSNVNKLGINPGSSFNTPIGVYGYPVDYVLKGVGAYFNVPFAGDRQYAHVFRVRDLDNCLVVSNDRDSFFRNSMGRTSFESGIIDFIERFFDPKRFYYSVEGLFWPNKIPDGILAYSTLYNNSSGEPQLSVNTTSVNIYQYIIANSINVPPNLPEFPGEDRIARMVGGDIGRAKLAAICHMKKYDSLELLQRLTRVSSDICVLWFFTMAVADVMSPQVAKSSDVKSKPSVVWSKIMRSLGVSGVIDKGLGLIHPNEPVQAVFFDIRNLIHLDVIKNSASGDSQFYNVAILARHGDFSYISTLSEGRFSDWVIDTINNIGMYIPNELINGLVNNDENYLFGPWWVYFTNLATTLRNVINMDAKRLTICKQNGGEKYMEIRPAIINGINDGVKLIRHYFDDFKAWFDKNARGDMGGRFSGENSKTPRSLTWNEGSFGYDDFDFISIRSSIDDLYKSIARLERAA